MTRIIFSLLALFISLKAFSYEHQKCTEELFHPITKKYGVGGQPGLLTVSSIAPTSTSQFVSSTGSCSYLRKKEELAKEVFFENYERIEMNAAAGDGEYLGALSFIYGCKSAAHKNEFNNLMKSNFTLVFGEEAKSEPEKSFKKLNEILKSLDPCLSALSFNI